MKKMKKMKKIFLLIMVVFGLVGCGEEKEVTTAKNETPTIRIVMQDFTPSNPTAVKFRDKLVEGLAKDGVNVNIELVEIPQGSYGEKLNLMIMSGNIPDLMYFEGGDEKMVEQGILENLTPYIKKSERIQDALEPFHKARLANFPYLLWINPMKSKVPMIRKSWLEEYGKTPVTANDYYDMFKYFHDKKGGYGVSATGNTERMDDMFNFAFGITSNWMKDTNGKYVYSKITENEKNKLAFYKKMYANKLIDPEYITTKWNTLEDKFYTQKTAIIVGSSGRVTDIYYNKLKEREPEEDLVILQPAKGIAHGLAPINVTKETRGMAISTQSKNKDLAFKILEYLTSEKGQLLEQYGFEGEQHNIVDGKIVLTEKIKNWYPKFFEVTTREMPIESLGEAGIASKNMAKNYYSEDKTFRIPSEYATKWDAMTNLYEEYAFKIISGEYELSKFDEFVEKWDKAGGVEVTKYANEVLN